MLFLKLHGWLRLTGVLLACAASLPLLRSLSGSLDVPRLAELVGVPTIIGTLLPQAATTPMSLIEASTPRRHALHALGYVVGAFVLAATVTAIGFGPMIDGRSWLSMVRNNLGQTGAGLMSASLWGGHRTFVLPTLVGIGAASVAGVGGQGPIRWMVAAESDPAPWVVAVVLFVAGLATFVGHAPIDRDSNQHLTHSRNSTIRR